MGNSAWHQVWRNRSVGAGTLGLPDLMAADGFDQLGAVDEASWRGYVTGCADRLGLRPGDSVFEVGCGAGAFLLPLAEAGCSVTGLDYSPELVAAARTALPGADIAVGEARDLDLAGGYDVVVSNGVFLYFPDLTYAATVLSRMVAGARRGVAVLDVPDRGRQEQALRQRRAQLGEQTYQRRYSGLDHLYFDRAWFDAIMGPSWVVQTCDQELGGYFNAAHRFNVFAARRPS